MVSVAKVSESRIRHAAGADKSPGPAGISVRTPGGCGWPIIRIRGKRILADRVQDFQT